MKGGLSNKGVTLMPRKLVKSEGAVVRINKEMHDAIVAWLGTRTAKEMGFDSISDVVTAAVRELLERHGYYEKRGA